MLEGVNHVVVSVCEKLTEMHSSLYGSELLKHDFGGLKDITEMRSMKPTPINSLFSQRKHKTHVLLRIYIAFMMIIKIFKTEINSFVR